MVFNVKRNSVSTYPTPKVNCTVMCYLSELDMVDENNAVYWIPFSIPLSECIGKTREQINDEILAKGTELFNSPEMSEVFAAIEVGMSLDTSEILI